MFKKLLYDYQTRNKYDPVKTKFLTKEDLAKVLIWEIKEQRYSERASDDIQRFYVVSTVWLESVDLPAVFDAWMIDDLFNKSQWFWLFCVKDDSAIIVPFSLRILIDKWRYLVLENKDSAWVWWGKFQVDKSAFTQVFPCDVDLSTLNKMIKDLLKQC